MSLPTTEWSTRPAQPDDEAALNEIVMGSFERGDLRDWARLDAQHLAGAASRNRHGVVVGVAMGEVVGFVWPQNEQLFIHPERRRRGYGTRLVAAGLEWVRTHGEAHLALAVPDGAASRPFLTALGFVPHSSLWLLRLPPEAAVPPPSFPPEFVAAVYSRDVDPARYVELINAAFADHPSPLTLSVDYVEQIHGRPDFDPAGILLLAATDAPERPIGFCRTLVTDDESRRIGEIALVGVRPEWRGRGLGRELLRWGVGHLRENGIEDLTLAVEARNERALALYERTGFVRVKEWPRWAKPV
jgi:mycothiol synthase